MTTFGSTTEDEHGVPIDRGPPEEMRMTENELRGVMKNIADAKISMGQAATVQGIAEEMKVLREMVDKAMEQHNAVIGLIGTLRGEFNQYKQQRAIELQSWLANGGSTTPEDMDGDLN
jgi:DNA-directed RNA polymerase sigma subunit (sigma70/sigma32)